MAMATSPAIHAETPEDEARLRVLNSDVVLDARAQWKALSDVAKQVHDSGIYSKRYTSPVQIALVMAHAQAVGLPPVTTLAQAYCVHGVVQLQGQALLAAITKSGLAGKIEYRENTTERVVVYMERKDGTASFESVWDSKRAKDTGNYDKHKAHLVEWMRWRAVAEAARLVFPEVLLGAYLPEEGLMEDPPPTRATVTVEPKEQRIGERGAAQLIDKLRTVSDIVGTSYEELITKAREVCESLCGVKTLGQLTREQANEVEAAVIEFANAASAEVPEAEFVAEDVAPLEDDRDPFEDE